MVNVFMCRHPRESALRFPLAANPLLLFGIAVEFGLLVLIVFTAPGNHIFATQPFDPVVWAAITFLALGFGALEEVRKFLVRRQVGMA
jgi:sodium/potassium-transporting ATPase subunit alpha